MFDCIKYFNEKYHSLWYACVLCAVCSFAVHMLGTVD